MLQAEGEVAVTIDDLPQGGAEFGLARMNRMTEQLVQGLVSHGVPAVGFVNEAQLYVVPGEVDQRIALLERWASAGIELGNHTFAHRRFRDITPAQFEDDVVRGETVTRILSERHQLALRYFRHPYLDTGPNLEERDACEQFLRTRGYTVAPVTIDQDDWMFALVYADARSRNDDGAMNRIAAEYLAYLDAALAHSEACAESLFGRRIRDVLLLHANELNAEHLDGVVNVLERRGYRFVGLERALDDEVYRGPNTFASDAGVTWLDRWAATRGVSFDIKRPEAPRWVQEAYARLDAVAPARIPGSRN